ncbi:phenylacetate-CoA oxygenase subunit PaaC [Ornithinimicrobium humiphilum]|uniref:Ring-1,2-phenylacetyl-CoA epoxidase subunit PaaC n=1 Tax=Ornithinimicrobium humiphilum TaxID=125288 RepID=A0A543KMD4_9MICO|nr:1,2-phenylacetyl-CoA epoxidase subunit PaaC [Ornithinimicrobium humiphilum]TQM96194.1 ring-1,2-phenylacetyl-CoA epoxidase subunit PaaC [Ornithinimicrobium humiphilum]
MSTVDHASAAVAGTRAPAEPDATTLHVRYLLGLGDDALVYAQRLGEWLTHAPQIEEDMALGNVGLDLLGQARSLLTRAGEVEGRGRDEDALAMLRDEREFRNVHLVERPRGDFAQEMARMLWFATYQNELWTRLLTSSDETLAAIAGKAVKEAVYHRDHATQWVLRLGDGTEESHRRMQAGLEAVHPYVAELGEDHDAARWAAESGVGVLPSSLAEPVNAYVASVLEQATLTMPDAPRWHARGGRDGIHSEAMGYLLAEMQHIARSHPGATW